MPSVVEHHGVKSPLPSLWKFGGLPPLKLVKLSSRRLERTSCRRAWPRCRITFARVIPHATFPGLAGRGDRRLWFADARQHRGIDRPARSWIGINLDSVIDQTFRNSSGVKLAAGILGALWAASGGMTGFAILVGEEVNWGDRKRRQESCGAG